MRSRKSCESATDGTVQLIFVLGGATNLAILAIIGALSLTETTIACALWALLLFLKLWSISYE